MMSEKRRLFVFALLLLLAFSLPLSSCTKGEAPLEDTESVVQPVEEKEKGNGNETNGSGSEAKTKAENTADIKAEPDSGKAEETEETEPTAKPETEKSETDAGTSSKNVETPDFSEFKDEKNAVVMSGDSGKLGDTVSHSVTVCGDVDFCAVSLDVQYDNSRLKFVSFESEHDLVTNFDTAGGLLHMNYVKASNEKEVLTLCRMSFEVLTDEACDAELSVNVKEIVGVDGSDISDREYTVHGGVCHLN